MKKVNIRYYSCSSKSSGIIPLQVCCSYKGKRLRTKDYSPELTASEFALFDSNGLLKNPLPPTDIDTAKIKQLETKMLNNRSFWIAVVDTFTEQFDWDTITSSIMEQYITANWDYIVKRSKDLRELGGR